MILVLKSTAQPEDVKKASEEYKTYIKVTADVEKEIVAIGGEYHFDAEQILIRMGCSQQNIWGGGIDLISKQIDTNAMINVRVRQNYSTEICDIMVKEKFLAIVKKYLGTYVNP